MNITPNTTRVKEAVFHSMFTRMFVRWGANNPLRTKLHASSLIVSASEWCEREHVLLDAYPEDAEPTEQYSSAHLNAIFVHGWSLHEKWQNLFKRYGRVVYRGFEPCLDLTHYHEQYDLRYSPDAIIEDHQGKWYPVEIKGINHDEYQAACALPLEQAVLHSETVKKARVQVILYMHLLNLQEGLILAEDKNTQQFRVWWLQYDQSLIQEYLDRLSSLADAKKSLATFGTLPERKCGEFDSPRAKRCPMRTLCFSNRRLEQ